MLARKGIRTVFKKGKSYKTRSPAEVIALARQMKASLKPYAEKIEIAGSIRRKRPDPIDVDIVMVPKDKLKIAEVLEKKGKITTSGAESIAANVKGVKVDIRYSSKEEWPTQLLTYSGPFSGNIGLRVAAKKKGWKLSQHGLYDKAGKRIPVHSEQDVYRKLDISYRQPEERGLPK
jgi:DNA polymerase (family 10)